MRNANSRICYKFIYFADMFSKNFELDSSSTIHLQYIAYSLTL